MSGRKPSRKCQVCGKAKAKKEFPRSVHAKDGHMKTCRVCFGKNMSKARKGKGTGPRTKSNSQKIADANTALRMANTSTVLDGTGDQEALWLLKGVALARGCSVPELVQQLLAKL